MNPESLYEVSKREASQLFIRALATGALDPPFAGYAAAFAVTGVLPEPMDFRLYILATGITSSVRYLLFSLKRTSDDLRSQPHNKGEFHYNVQHIRAALKEVKRSLKVYEALRDTRANDP
jgi:hypothetical protein